ncbi:MAG TPA: hypothetical protein DCS13_08820 [Candidatus Margulisbacteria bacterium]|nr:MAG: hypothetical protein A2X43_01915 [Candidatus Margulisbacteria bacterium GWD2_39_127]HAR63551.1 hypothetical protein [Candidatus Margulisiibacteriota bacterium]
MNKKIVLGVIVTIVAVAGGVYFKTAKGDQGTAYSSELVKRRTLQVVVSSSGTINAYREIEVKSKASGNVLKLHVKEGNIVNNGQLLLELDKTEELSRIRQNQASVMAAEARMTQAKEKGKEAARIYKQQATLAKDKLITSEQLLQAESSRILAGADMKIQEAALINAQEQLKAEELRYADTEIKAPINGVILQQLIEEGQIISSGISSNNGGTLIFVIGDISRIIAKAEVDEVDISKIYVGQKVNITVDAYENRIFEGVITHISPKATNKSNVTVFDIEIEITDKHKASLKPGMTATAEIVVSQKINVLSLPSQAIVTRKKSSFVLLKENNDYVKRKIEKGLDNGEYTEIIRGLNEGDTVYVKQKGKGLDNSNNQRGGAQSSMRMMGRIGR